MKNLIKAQALRTGDKVAAVSLSAGLAGSIPYRYQIGKKQLEQQFDITIFELPHTVDDINKVKNSPKARAHDIMPAFADPDVKDFHFFYIYENKALVEKIFNFTQRRDDS